jgi:hypothetical protein
MKNASYYHPRKRFFEAFALLSFVFLSCTFEKGTLKNDLQILGFCPANWDTKKGHFWNGGPERPPGDPFYGVVLSMVYISLGPNPGNIRIKGGIKEDPEMTPKMGDFRGSRLGLRRPPGGPTPGWRGQLNRSFSVLSVLLKIVNKITLLPCKRFLGVPQKVVKMGSKRGSELFLVSCKFWPVLEKTEKK